MDITTDFGSVIVGSSPAGRTAVRRTKPGNCPVLFFVECKLLCTRTAVRDGGMSRAQFQGHGTTESREEALSKIGAKRTILLSDLTPQIKLNCVSSVPLCEAEACAEPGEKVSEHLLKTL